MAKRNRYLTPWLQEVLDAFKSHPSEKTYREILDSPLPERIKSAVRDTYKRWISSVVLLTPRKLNRERERNI